MMRKVVLVLAMMIALVMVKGYGQNLVPNYSFEDTIPYATCHTVSSDPLACVPQWMAARGISIYLSEIWGGYSSVPSNGAGYQYPRTGIAMSFFQGNVYFNSLNQSNRGYIETPLLDSLISGKKYCVRFYVSLGESSIYGIDCIGAYFSNDIIPYNIDTPWSRIPVIPQIENPKHHFLVDTINWMEVSGSFVAKGGEKYMTIGNFRPDSLTDTFRIKPIFGGAYMYYIDDVFVIAINEDTAHAGIDTTICQGDSVMIGSPVKSNYNYVWTPGAGLDDNTKAQPMASPSVTTTYVLNVIVTDTIYAPLCRSSVVIPDSITITVKNCKPPNTVFLYKLYPNPNDGNFILEYNITSEGIFNLYDVLGQIILRQNIQSGQGTQNIYIGSISSGIYFWQMRNEEGILGNGKVLIIKD